MSEIVPNTFCWLKGNRAPLLVLLLWIRADRSKVRFALFPNAENPQAFRQQADPLSTAKAAAERHAQPNPQGAIHGRGSQDRGPAFN